MKPQINYQTFQAETESTICDSHSEHGFADDIAMNIAYRTVRDNEINIKPNAEV